MRIMHQQKESEKRGEIILGGRKEGGGGGCTGILKTFNLLSLTHTEDKKGEGPWGGNFPHSQKRKKFSKNYLFGQTSN